MAIHENEFKIEMLSEALKESKEQSMSRIKQQNQEFDINKLESQIDENLKKEIEESSKQTQLLQDQINKQEEEYGQQKKDLLL